MTHAPKNKISALIITYNEIDNIADCIASIDFADEIVVIDSYSTDGTFEWLKAHQNIRVIQHPFKNFTAQKNYAIRHARNEWVLFIDADERVTPALKAEILSTVKNPETDVNAYWFYRKFMYKGKPLHFSGWQTDKNIRLFRRGKAAYSNRRIVHETLEVEGRTAVLKNKLTHYCFKGYEDFRSKKLMYGRMKAKEAFMDHRSFSIAKLIIKPTYKFLYNYLIRFGFLDGLKGIVICYLGAVEDLERFRELRRLEVQSRTKLIYPAFDKARVEFENAS